MLWRIVQTSTQRRHTTSEEMCGTVSGIQVITFVVVVIVVVAVGKVQLSYSSKTGINEREEAFSTVFINYVVHV